MDAWEEEEEATKLFAEWLQEKMIGYSLLLGLEKVDSDIPMVDKGDLTLIPIVN
jgi:hypothetical protein